MKKALVLSLTLMLVLGFFGLSLAAETGKMTLKVGDTVYACDCGEGCPCNTLSKKPGNCACGKEMVEAKVVKVEEGTASLQAQGWEKPLVFKTVGKYACDCGPSCDCNTISQNPGKCVCGKDLKKVE
jgi:hypothetical protein